MYGMYKVNTMNKIPALVSSKWLYETLQKKPKNLRVLDTSWYLPSAARDTGKEYQECHIPGAQFFDLNGCIDKTSPYDHMLPSVGEFEDYVGHLGINNNTQVILYDSAEGAMFSSQRTWWTFRVFGHLNVSILEGGLRQWKAAGYNTTEHTDTVPVEKFKASYNSDLVKSFEDIVNNVTQNKFQLVDARPPKRFKGEAPEPRPGIKSGHIPGTFNVFFMSLQNKEAQTMKTPDEIQQLFQNAGVDLQKPVTATCGSGVSACMLALGAFLCGKEDVAVYDGSWCEYYQRAPAELKEDVPDGDVK